MPKADAAGAAEERLQGKEQSVPKLELGNELKLKVGCRFCKKVVEGDYVPLILPGM
ncbi:hypothetical protein WDW89_11570 [Deltaproteobacteria bacterium TL4]